MPVVAIKKNMILQNMHSLKDKNLFGRNKDCDVIIPEVYISRRHFLIEKINEGFIVKNLSSKDIKINGSIKKELKLKHNDIIQLGDYEIVFLDDLQKDLYKDTFDYRYHKGISNKEFYFLYVVKNRIPSFYIFNNNYKAYIEGYFFSFNQNILKIEDKEFLIQNDSMSDSYLDMKFTLFKNTNTNFFKNHPFYNFYTVNEKLINQFEQILLSSKTDFPIFLHGETGAGKDVMSNTIHKISKREGAFVALNCSSISDNLWESELFGHKKGSFTGAEFDKKGAFQLANKGTIFLDEIAELPLEQQAKLLRVLETKKVKSLGSENYETVDVRIISATHKDILKLVEEKKFREDLFHRIYVFPVNIPPLRDRKKDIVLYSKLFIKRLNEKMQLNKKISDSALEYLSEHFWPGNVRELKNVIQRAYIISQNTIEKDNIFILKWKKDSPKKLKDIMDHAILDTLIKFDFNKKKTYEELDISRSKLYRWIEDNKELLKGFDYE